MPTDSPTWEDTIEEQAPAWEDTTEEAAAAPPLKPVTAAEVEANINPYERARRVLPPGRMTPFGPEHPEEILAIPEISKIPGAIVQKVRDVLPPLGTAMDIYNPRTALEKGLEGLHEAVAPAVSDFLRTSGIDPSSTPDKIINFPRATAQNVPNLPGLPPSNVMAGVLNLAAGTGEMLAQPENAVLALSTGGEGIVSRAAALLFAAQQFQALPGQIKEAITTIADPNKSLPEKIQAAGQPGVNALFTAGMVRAGTRPIRKVAPPIETAGESIPQINLEQPGLTLYGSELAGRPRGAVPVTARAGTEVLGPPAPRSVRLPEVPATAAQPQETAVAEIRRTNARTKGQIQALFPQISREQAAALRDQAWGAQPQPEPPTAPPAAAETPRPPVAPTAPGAAAPVAPHEELVKLLETKPFASTEDAFAIGMKAKSIADLDGLLSLRTEFAAKKADIYRRAEAEPDMTKKIAILGEAAPLAYRSQLANEAIQAATKYTKSRFDKLPEERPLDFEKNADVRAWLIRNADKLAEGDNLSVLLERLTGEPLRATTPEPAPPVAPTTPPVAQTLPVVSPEATPVAPAPPEAQWLGKPLSYWEQLANKLPLGSDRASLARSLGVANQPAKIKRQILRRVEEIRRQPPAAPPAPEPTVTPTAPPVAPEVAPAAAKAQTEVSKVAATEGKRSATEVKEELISELQQKLMKAPSEPKPGETVTVDIPGDGVFTVPNTVDAISLVLERARKIKTDPGKAPGVPKKAVKQSERAIQKTAGRNAEIAAEVAKGPTVPPAEPAPIGMGAAALGEVQPTGPRGEPVHGIAARVSEAAAGQGIIAPVEPGEGIAAAESVSRGRELLAQGADPQAVLDEFNRTKAVTADGMAVVRAHGERLRKAAYAAADKFGVLSEQYEKAWEADSDWTKAIKPLQTEWHKIGQAQQGEVEIDTGTFHGLRMAHIEATGKDFTPDQAKTAKEIAEGVQKATQEADKAKDDVLKTVAQQAPQSAAVPPVTAAKPPPGTPAPTAPTPKAKPGIARPSTVTVWNRARAIIDGGETDFDNLRHKLAIEFGLPVDEITKILAEPKAARALTDEMYRKMSERRRLTTAAKNWLKDQQLPRWRQFIRNVPRIFFIDKVFGHGTVGMITHAGLNIFNPSAWATYWPNFLRQYRLLASGAYHERMMQDLVRDPLFTKARRAGLANDPFRYQDDYQTPGMAKWLGRLGLAGNRGFDSLKLFRQARFNQIWNGLDPKMQTKEYASIVADAVNHATGVVRTSFGGEWANWTFFAPKLEGSRWAWMIGDPFKAATTFVDWRAASPEARAFAVAELKQKAAVAGTYLSLLAINQGILSASGSDEKINYTNPRRSDFLSFKAAGHNIGIVGPMLGMVRLFANLLHASMGKRGKLESLQSRADEFGSLASQYARGKLSPFAGFGVDLASQADFQGRPLPFSKDVVPKYLRQQGIDRYTYGEYAAQEFTPIPVSEAVREVWRDQGMHDKQIQTYLDALLVGAVAGGTGARISVEQPKRK